MASSGTHASTAHGTEQAFTTPSLVLNIDTNEYRPQLDRKLERFQAMFSSLPPSGEALPQLEVFESVPKNYRMRAEFTCWGVKPQAGKEPDVHFIMYDSANKVKPPPM
ncbi:hypothetical protein DUNSADRAFT_10686 [Dunaliella salina]|uniref:Uncharacterized protein n=1 Tax=Dunaliella salina TaxID=3046 RepID=A0ABQ7GES6_DUNSA|nr:hypothetical protein DUNSADRAFT_10686 [Dunaliella salina]|eukprot:KAF5833105.1 hypothetical protein DUNSADRAFT_10686 [Dunaliella salina]